MWNLVMGGAYSSEESETEETGGDVVEKELEEVSKEPEKVHMAVKHRIPSPSRECGDGSEADPDTPTKSTAVPSETKPRLIHLPQTNIKLEKLPPIKDVGIELRQTSPNTPLVQMPVTGQFRHTKPHHQAPKKDKEPKFVPYEPYKAAVTPLVTGPMKKKKSGSSLVSGAKETQKSDIGSSVSAENNAVDSEVVRELQKQLNAKDEAMAAVKRELAEKDKQLKIQIQVNSEVKRLLVASVGEDIEAKVDYLTQDKARLSADIRQYASRISRDFEEKEQLSVESNLWKSKFLACSVVVDELARWKANLLHHAEESEHQIRLLVHEHSVLWSSLIDSYELLCRMNAAFDPLAARQEPAEGASLLGLADHVLKAGQLLRERLMGTVKEGPKTTIVIRQLDTPAEEGLKNVITRPVGDPTSDYSELASLAVTGAAKLHLRKLGDQLSAPSASTSFKNCTHCHGAVHNI